MATGSSVSPSAAAVASDVTGGDADATATVDAAGFVPTIVCPSSLISSFLIHSVLEIVFFLRKVSSNSSAPELVLERCSRWLQYSGIKQTSLPAAAGLGSTITGRISSPSL